VFNRWSDADAGTIGQISQAARFPRIAPFTTSYFVLISGLSTYEVRSTIGRLASMFVIHSASGFAGRLGIHT
jgi:hypothetical protein